MQFLPLDISQEDSIADVLLYIDNTIQYGEDLDIKVPKVGHDLHAVMLLKSVTAAPATHTAAILHELSNNQGTVYIDIMDLMLLLSALF